MVGRFPPIEWVWRWIDGLDRLKRRPYREPHNWWMEREMDVVKCTLGNRQLNFLERRWKRGFTYPSREFVFRPIDVGDGQGQPSMCSPALLLSSLIYATMYAFHFIRTRFVLLSSFDKPTIRENKLELFLLWNERRFSSRLYFLLSFSLSSHEGQSTV